MMQAWFDIGSTALSWSVQALLCGTLLAALTALVCSLALRKARPGLHALLWTVVLVRFLLPPILPSLPYLDDAGAWLSAEMGSWLPGDAHSSDPLPSADRVTLSPANPERGGQGWIVLAGILYLAGLAIVTARSARSNLRSHRWVANLPAADPSLAGAVRSLGSQIGLKRMPRVKVTDAVTSPFVLGVLRPKLVLSRPLWELLSPRAARALVLHELAHVRRRDPFVRCVQALARLLLFFWPPVHWVARRFERAAELACDQWALRESGVDPREYARSLLVVVRSMKRERVPVTHLAFANQRSSMEERFEMILKKQSIFSTRLSRNTLLALIAWCAFALVGLSATSAQEPAPATDHKLVIDIRGETADFSLGADLLPDADVDLDGRLTLEELQDFQDRHPDRLELIVEPAGAGQREIQIRASGTAEKDAPLWVAIGREEDPVSVVHVVTDATLDEDARAHILNENPLADSDGDGQLSDKELQALLGSGPEKIEVVATQVGGEGDATHEIVVKLGGPADYTTDEGRLFFSADSLELFLEHPDLDANGDGILDPGELQNHADRNAKLQNNRGVKHLVRIERIQPIDPVMPELSSAERRAKFLEDHPEADLDGDGVVSKAEAEALAAKIRKTQ